MRSLKDFRSDESGLALILVAILLPVLVGFALLVIDMSRANNLHNDTQRGADSLALAAAAELDGGPDAWARSQNTIATLVHNNTRFSDGGDVALSPGGTITIDPDHSACRSSGNLSWCFLKSIPATDDLPITVSNYASDASETLFIQIKATPEPFTTIFPASFLGSSDTMSIGSEAVAGFRSGVCNFTPLFICNPYEVPSEVGNITLREAIADPQYRRRQIELRSVGNGSDYFPGNFGFLDSPGANGARGLAEMLASSRPRSCYSSRGVDTKTGQNSGPVKAAINLRFGIQEPGSGSWNSAEYGPAKNVRKGAIRTSGNQNQCPSSNQLTWGAPNVGLPVDPCFGFNNCPLMSGHMGDTNWDFHNYWYANHGSNPYPPAWDTTPPTRYQIYHYETFDQPARIADASTGGETGTPSNMCGAPVTSVDRRLLYGAIINCRELEAAGRDLSGHEVQVPVEAFASFFMTDPVRKVPQTQFDASIFVELVDITGQSGQGTLDDFQRDEVQLYR